MKSLSKADLPDSYPEETIRRRAYEIYETQGKKDGHDREHWLQAEAEVAAGAGGAEYERLPEAHEAASTARKPVAKNLNSLRRRTS